MSSQSQTQFRRLEGSTVVQAIDPPSVEVERLWTALVDAIGAGRANAVVNMLAAVDGNWTIRGLLYHWQAGNLR